MIRINVSRADATLTETETLTEGRVGLRCAFTFGEEWNGLQKIAYFQGADEKSVAMVDGDEVEVPWECLASAGYKLNVGVRGDNASGDTVIPTVWVRAGKIVPSPDSGIPEGEEPTPSVVAQIQQAAANALLISKNVAEQAESGAFKGDKGDTGEPGDPGVYIGTTPPTDPDVTVWIDPNGPSYTPGAIDEELSSTSENPVQNKVVKAALDTKADQASVQNAYIPRSISPKVVSAIYSGGMVEKSSGIDGITFQTNNYTIRDCSASGIVDLSNATHGIVQNLHLNGENVGINIEKESGWSGSNKLSNLFSFNCAYPFKLLCDDVTDSSIRDSTFEGFRQAIITNNRLTIKDSYFGDNRLTTDDNNPDCAILAKSGAKVVLSDCELGVGVRDGQNNPIIKFDSTESSPAVVEIRNSIINSTNQNLSGGGYGGIAELSNKNDRLFLDNCYFTIFKRINYNHSVAPFVLKPYQTVWSKNPFYNYLCGGDLSSILAFAPRGTNITEADTENVNPFGGKIIRYTHWFFAAYYEIPEYLIGKTMYLHIYCCKLESPNCPGILYENSDCEETAQRSSNFNQGYHGMVTPYLNIIPFTPSKKRGKVVFYIGTNGAVTLAGAFLVEDIHKDMVCRYKNYSNKIYSGDIPLINGEYGDMVYSIDPQATNCDGWKYTTEWQAF